MNAQRKISIITPSLNQGQFLEETICSVLDQNYGSLEYLVIDGGSTDKSVEIIRKYEKHLAYWVSEADNGQPQAVNKGLRRASGEIVSFINSDDLLEPGSLQHVAEAFQSGCQWLASPARCFDESGKTWTYHASDPDDPVNWFYKMPIPQQGCFWARALHERAGYLREEMQFAFDYEFFLRLRFKHGLRPAVTQRSLGAFRYQAASKTVSLTERFEPEERAVRKEYRKYLPGYTRARCWAAERREIASKRQLTSLRLAGERRKEDAARKALSSIAMWPPMLFSRRSAGLARRIVWGAD